MAVLRNKKGFTRKRDWVQIMSDVYVVDLSRGYTFSKTDKTDYQPILSKEERDSLVYYLKRNINGLFNGDTVRLNGISKTPSHDLILDISLLSYFDSLTTNMLYANYSNKLSKLSPNNTFEEKIIQIITSIDEVGKSSVEEILSNYYLANTIGVSVLVQDITGKYCMILRKKNLAVGAGLLSVTVTGAVDGTDYKSEDPVLSCARRELKEELGIDDCVLFPRYIAFSKKKLQPIFIIDAEIPMKWDEITNAFSSATDFTKEVNDYIIADWTELDSLVRNNTMTDAGRFHVDTVINNMRNQK